MVRDFQTDALYGESSSNGMLTATTVNGNQASSDWDWGAILANGIRGAAYGAMQASVQGAYASGQLQPLPGQYVRPAGALDSLLPLLLIGGLVAFAVAD